MKKVFALALLLGFGMMIGCGEPEKVTKGTAKSTATTAKDTTTTTKVTDTTPKDTAK